MQSSKREEEKKSETERDNQVAYRSAFAFIKFVLTDQPSSSFKNWGRTPTTITRMAILAKSVGENPSEEECKKMLESFRALADSEKIEHSNKSTKGKPASLMHEIPYHFSLYLALHAADFNTSPAQYFDNMMSILSPATTYAIEKQVGKKHYSHPKYNKAIDAEANLPITRVRNGELLSAEVKRSDIEIDKAEGMAIKKR